MSTESRVLPVAISDTSIIVGCCDCSGWCDDQATQQVTAVVGIIADREHHRVLRKSGASINLSLPSRIFVRYRTD
jgi:hypothetical protein